MRTLLRAVLQWACLSALAAMAAGAQLPAQAHVGAEIEGLLERVAASGCAFERNGQWHAAGDASRHLRRKFGYLQLRGMIESAENFVQLAGARSSETGRAYIVRCPGVADVATGDWLSRQLQELRARGR